ncbi:MAG: acyl-CoA thioesterase [Candidatus Latescibacteria bacterium]|nr:acyl-CoA thioesterase [Candidatus Latescibacterota bacterium]
MHSEFHTTRRVEFSDTDMAGIVHFSRFFVFMEAAEHAFLRSLGTSVSAEWKGNKIGWPRLEATCTYLSPAVFEDVLDIHLKVIRKGTKSLTYRFDFFRGETAIASGKLSTVCCICNPGEKIRSIPIPDFIADQIQVADENIEAD